MIPLGKSAAVSRALHEAFGTSDIEDIRTVPSGLSSDLVFRLIVKGSPFLLKIMTRIDERNDPRRIFAAMTAEAEAGVSPRVWHVNIEDGISITDFVEAKPLPVGEALLRVPGTLRRLHAAPPFSKTFNYVTAHNGFIWKFRTANLVPKREVEEVFTRHEQLCAIYPRLDSDMVSSHGDLKPENIVFDGQRVWLVNPQAAFLNDRYFDLTIVANFLVTSDADERFFLEQYFGQAPDAYQLARFFLMSQVMHMFYATVFQMLGSAGRPVDQSGPWPLFRDFHRNIWAGDVNLADNEMKTIYGRVHWERLLHNVREARFDEALRIVSDRHAGPETICRLLPTAP